MVHITRLITIKIDFKLYMFVLKTLRYPLLDINITYEIGFTQHNSVHWSISINKCVTANLKGIPSCFSKVWSSRAGKDQTNFEEQ